MLLLTKRLTIKQYREGDLDDFNSILTNDDIMKDIRGKGHDVKAATKKFQEALDIAVAQFTPAWDLKPDYDGGSKLEIKVKNCFIRELCKEEGIELGGDLCILFYNYLAGYTGKLGNARLKLLESCPGSKECKYDIEVFIRK